MQAEKKNLTLKTRIDPDIPSVIFTDGIRFKQILLNLLVNAIKFTFCGFVELCVIMKERYLKVSVIDTGIGIS